MSVWASKTAARLGETINISWNYPATSITIISEDDTSTYENISYSFKVAESDRSMSIQLDGSGFFSGNVFKDTVDSVRACNLFVWPVNMDQTDYQVSLKITITFPAVYNDLAVVDVSSTEDRLVSKRWVNVGESIGVYSTCAAEFTRKLFYQLESGDYVPLDENPEAIKIWEIPKQFAAEFPAKTSIKCTVCQDVYFGEQIARAKKNGKSFTIYVPNCEETSPKNVTAQKTILHALPPQFGGVPVQSVTKVRVTMTAESDYSTIEQYSISGNGVSAVGNPAESVLAKAGNIQITCKATDARGYSSSVVVTQPVAEYAEPRILPATGRTKVICDRCNQIGSVTDDGTHLRILAKRSYSPVEWNGKALNDCEMQYRVDGGAWQTILEKTAESDVVDLTLGGVVDDIYRSYTVDLRAVDGIGKEKILSFTVSSASVDFHLWNGKAAFFKYAERDHTVDVNGDVMVREDLILPEGTVLDYIIDQGSIGNWNWRKWASGVAECWGANTTGSEIVVSGSITVNEKAYPPSLFSSPPVEHFMLYSPDCDTSTIRIKNKNTKISTAAYKVAVLNVTSTETIKKVTTETYYRAIGRWK